MTITETTMADVEIVDNTAPTKYIAGQTAFGKDILIERVKPKGWKITLNGDLATPAMFDGIFLTLEDAQWIAHIYQMERVHRYRVAQYEQDKKAKAKK